MVSKLLLKNPNLVLFVNSTWQNSRSILIYTCILKRDLQAANLGLINLKLSRTIIHTVYSVANRKVNMQFLREQKEYLDLVDGPTSEGGELLQVIHQTIWYLIDTTNKFVVIQAMAS